MKKTNENKAKKWRKWAAIVCAVLVFAAAVFGVLQLGCVYTEKTWEHWRPSYEKVDIQTLLEKEILSANEYELLYRQTGLTKIAVDDMRNSAEGRTRILKIQEGFFTDYTVKNKLFNIFTYIEKIDGVMRFAYLQDGDIIVSSTTRVSWWRYGHAAIVINAQTGTIAEAIAPGTKSKTNSISTFNDLANFIILRPKVDEQTKKEIVDYVSGEMIGVPYRLTTGIFTKKFQEKLTASQCAHFVWYAYKKFGIDLDSTGGRVVKPQDMARSENVEVVQAFGFDLDKLWS